MDAFNIALNRVHRHFVRLFNTVPYTEVLAVLGHNNVRIRYPTYVLAVVQQGLLFLVLHVVQVQLFAFISEKKLCTARVQL